MDKKTTGAPQPTTGEKIQKAILEAYEAPETESAE